MSTYGRRTRYRHRIARKAPEPPPPPLLSSDAGPVTWSVTRRRNDRPAGYRLLAPEAADLGGFLEQVNVGCWRMLTKDRGGLFSRSWAITCDAPATVIVCENALALRAVLKRIAELDDLPPGFSEFSKECRRLARGFSF